MFELEIDGDFITWTKSFLINQTVQLIIDKHENKEQEKKIGFLQKLPVLPILFLIYISGIFYQVIEAYSLITSFSFDDSLEFIASRSLIKEIIKILEKFAKTVL